MTTICRIQINKERNIAGPDKVWGNPTQKQIDSSALCICPLIDDKFHHNIAACGSRHYDNIMKQFIINKKATAQKTDVNLLIFKLKAIY